jgi:heme-degrading monooxygenase HmoA
MLAVIFEFWTNPDKAGIYWDHAKAMGELVKDADGFISIERFESVSETGKFVSLLFWRDKAAVQAWRNRLQHRAAQSAGRAGAFKDYRLRVAEVNRDYGMERRDEAPADSRDAHG